MAKITPVGTVDLNSLGIGTVFSPRFYSWEHVDCGGTRLTLPPPPVSPRFVKSRAWVADQMPEKKSEEKLGGGFIGTPRIRFRLNRANVETVNTQLPNFGDGKDFKWCLKALNSRSIRVGGWQYEYTTGTPTCWLVAKTGMTATWGTIFDRKPMTVQIEPRRDAWADWVHFCRILIHEFEGHGTNEFGFNWPNGGHCADALAMMSYQPIDYRVINPFRPSAVSGNVVWGLTSYSELGAFQKIAGQPIYKD